MPENDVAGPNVAVPTLELGPSGRNVLRACVEAKRKVGCIPPTLLGLMQASGIGDVDEQGLDEAIASGMLTRDSKGKLSLATIVEPVEPVAHVEAKAMSEATIRAFFGQAEAYINFFEDDAILTLSEQAQNLLLRMREAADHCGRGPADLALLQAHLKISEYPFKEIAELVNASLVHTYLVDGHRYYEIDDFYRSSLPKDEPSLYPDPPSDESEDVQ